jgi:hypothetical protein
MTSCSQGEDSIRIDDVSGCRQAESIAIEGDIT